MVDSKPSKTARKRKQLELQKLGERLIELNDKAGGNVVGPKSYHFVIGGSTPAALAADLGVAPDAATEAVYRRISELSV